jgi:predicted lipid carrier protein YhbT
MIATVRVRMLIGPSASRLMYVPVPEWGNASDCLYGPRDARGIQGSNPEGEVPHDGKDRVSMNDEVRAFFEDVAKRGYDARLRGAVGSCEFDFDDGGSWRVTDADGWVTVAEGPGEVDCHIAAYVDDFLAMARGEMNPVTVAMRCGVQITGDFALAQVIQRLLPAPDALPDDLARTLMYGQLKGKTDHVRQDSQHS